jgi:hypothetical protein
MFYQIPTPTPTPIATATNNGNGNMSLMDGETYLTCLWWHCVIAFVLFFGIAYAMRKKWTNKWIDDDCDAFRVAIFSAFWEFTILVAIFNAFWEFTILGVILKSIFEKIRGK